MKTVKAVLVFYIGELLAILFLIWCVMVARWMFDIESVPALGSKGAVIGAAIGAAVLTLLSWLRGDISGGAIDLFEEEPDLGRQTRRHIPRQDCEWDLDAERRSSRP